MAEDAKEAKDEAAAPAPPAKAAGGGNKMLMPMMLIMNTALMGGVLFYVLKRPATVTAAPAATDEAAETEGDKDKEKGKDQAKAKAKGKDKDKPEGPGIPVKLESFIIQLRSSDSDRYLKIALDLTVATEEDKNAIGERLSQIRDAVITYFSDRTLEELRGSEGMERTKQSLFKRLDEVVPGKRIKQIYVTDFIVQ